MGVREIADKAIKKIGRYFPLIIGFSILIWGIYASMMRKEINRPRLEGNKLIIPLDENWTYACLGRLCVTIPKNSEFVLFVNPDVICTDGKRMYIDSENGTIIYAIVCKNSTLEELVRKRSAVLLRVST